MLLTNFRRPDHTISSPILGILVFVLACLACDETSVDHTCEEGENPDTTREQQHPPIFPSPSRNGGYSCPPSDRIYRRQGNRQHRAIGGLCIMSTSSIRSSAH